MDRTRYALLHTRNLFLSFIVYMILDTKIENLLGEMFFFLNWMPHNFCTEKFSCYISWNHLSGRRMVLILHSNTFPFICMLPLFPRKLQEIYYMSGQLPYSGGKKYLHTYKDTPLEGWGIKNILGQLLVQIQI